MQNGKVNGLLSHHIIGVLLLVCYMVPFSLEGVIDSFFCTFFEYP
jgi:hypothetical protein